MSSADPGRTKTEALAKLRKLIREVRSLGLGLDAAAEILATHHSGAAPCGRTGQLLDQRIAEIDHTLRELRELRATLVTARRTNHHTNDDVGGDPESICPMIEDAATPARR